MPGLFDKYSGNDPFKSDPWGIGSTPVSSSYTTPTYTAPSSALKSQATASSAPTTQQQSGGSSWLDWARLAYGLYQDNRDRNQTPNFVQPPMSPEARQLFDLYIKSLMNPATLNNAADVTNAGNKILEGYNGLGWKSPKTFSGDVGFAGATTPSFSFGGSGTPNGPPPPQGRQGEPPRTEIDRPDPASSMTANGIDGALADDMDKYGFDPSMVANAGKMFDAVTAMAKRYGASAAAAFFGAPEKLIAQAGKDLFRWILNAVSGGGSPENPFPTNQAGVTLGAYAPTNSRERAGDTVGRWSPGARDYVGAQIGDFNKGLSNFRMPAVGGRPMNPPNNGKWMAYR